MSFRAGGGYSKQCTWGGIRNNVLGGGYSKQGVLGGGGIRNNVLGGGGYSKQGVLGGGFETRCTWGGDSKQGVLGGGHMELRFFFTIIIVGMFCRYKQWEGNGLCRSGKILRNICIIGVRTLPTLLDKAYGKYLAANKFIWKFQPMAWDCVQLWHYQKIEQEYKTKRIAFDAESIVKKLYFS